MATLRLRGDNAYAKRYQDEARQYLSPDDTNATLFWAANMVQARTEFLNARGKRI